jgi:hypothetical protein
LQLLENLGGLLGPVSPDLGAKANLLVADAMLDDPLQPVERT